MFDIFRRKKKPLQLAVPDYRWSDEYASDEEVLRAIRTVPRHEATYTATEMYYASIATGTQLNTFTTEDNLQKTLPHVLFPRGFFNPANIGTGKAIRVRAYLRWGTTGAPTFTLSIRLLTSTTWSAGGVAWSTAAMTAGTTVTLAPVQVEFDIIARTIGTGGAANTTVAGMGMVTGGTAFAAAGSTFSIPNSNTAFTNTIDSASDQYLYLSAACGTSNSLNLVQLEMLKVWVEN